MCAARGPRESQTSTPRLVEDSEERAPLEARNGIRQFDRTREAIRVFLDPERPSKLRPSLIKQLHGIAMEGISAYAGRYRPSDATITHSEHTPPPPHQVDELMEALCDEVNDLWSRQANTLYVAAYVMWRLNWIHPFSDGNGRTSRCVAYLVLCVGLGEEPFGSYTIPQQIADNREPYFQALEAADAAARGGTIDISLLQDLLQQYLVNQLLSARAADI